jgi:HEAT repeat protein
MPSNSNIIRTSLQLFIILGLLLNSSDGSATSEGSPEQLLGQLRDKKPDEVQLALYQLAQFGDSLADNDAVKVRIAELLQDRKQPDAVREVAAYALGRIGPGAATQIPALEAALADKSPRVKRATAEALGRIGANRDDVVEYLNKAFQTGDLSVRVACIAGFASIEPKEAVVLRLSNIVSGDDAPELKRAAAFALAQMTPNIAIAVPALQHALANGDPELQQVSGWALGLVGPGASRAVPQLVEALHAKKDAIRRVAADALGRIGAEDDYVAAALTERLLNDSNLDVKTACAMTLGRFGYRPTVASALFKALQAEDDPALMLAAATAIAKINPRPNSDVKALIKVAKKGPFADVREAAIRAIGHIHQRPDQAVPALSTSLTDPIPTVATAAAEALGEYGESASSALQALTMASKDPRMRLASSRAIGRIALSLRNRFEMSFDRHDAALRLQLDDDRKELDRALREDPEHIDADSVIVLGQAIKALDRNILTFRINEWLRQHKLLTWISLAVLAYLAWLAFLYFVVLRVFPLVLIRWSQALEKLGGVQLPESLGGLTVRLRDLLILNFYRDHRVLDAWVERYADRAQVNFENQGIRKSRNVFCALPVEIDNDLLAAPNADALRKHCERDRWLLRVVGEGGVGKTTLACQIALWALDKDRNKRPCQARRMIPVILERGSGLEALRDLSYFKLAVRGLLRDLIGETKELPEWLCDELSRDRRILVVVDGLSEMNLGTETPLPLHPEFSVAALIITSRSPSLWADVNHADIQPRRIDRDHLLPFMNAYLGKASQSLKDDEVWDACKQLSVLVGTGRSITPLLARLYAEQLANTIAFKREVARNIPDLILGYITTLNRERRSEDPDDVTLHRAAELTAWECCRHTFNAGYARKEKVMNVLAAQGGLRPELLDLLEKRLQLVRTIPPAETHIEFTLDPIAEFLAGLWLVHSLQGEGDWFEFLRQADCSASSPESVSAFLAAVLECCKVERFNGSASVLEGLRSRIVVQPPPGKAA